MAAPGPAQVPPAYAYSVAPAYGAPGDSGYGAPPNAAAAEPAPGSSRTWDRPVPEPPVAQPGASACEDSCDLANDGSCDDGRPGAGSDLCIPGTDCSDCGA